MRLNVRLYFHNGWVALDQLANAWLLAGAPDETISSRLGRLKDDSSRPRRARLACMVCWLLDLIDRGHCDNTEKYEKSITHRPESINDKTGD